MLSSAEFFAQRGGFRRLKEREREPVQVLGQEQVAVSLRPVQQAPLLEPPELALPGQEPVSSPQERRAPSRRRRYWRI